MNRSDLILTISAQHPLLTAKDVDLSVKAIFDAISNTISQNGRIEIRGFGSFCLNYRLPRKGRNPKSGESVLVPAKYVSHFKAGKDLRERVCSSAGSD